MEANPVPINPLIPGCVRDQVASQPVEIARFGLPHNVSTPSTLTLTCGESANKTAETWVREGESYVIAATLCGDELKLRMSQVEDGVTICLTLTAEYTLTKDGLVHGVITGVDAEMKAGQSSGGHHPTNYAMTLTQLKLSLHELIDCPFSFRTRMTSAGLMVSNPKLAFSGDDLRDTVQLLGGMYKPSKDGAVPLPKPRKPAIRASESSRPTVAADDLPATPTPPPAPTLPPPSYTSPSPPPIPILPSDGWESKNSIQPPAIQQGFDKKHLYSFSMGIFGGPCESPETKVATTPPMACPSAQFNPDSPCQRSRRVVRYPRDHLQRRCLMPGSRKPQSLP